MYSYIPVLSQDTRVLVQPRKRSTSITEQAEIDLRTHVQCYDIGKRFSSSIRYSYSTISISIPPSLWINLIILWRSLTSHFLQILWPILSNHGLEFQCCFLNFRPGDFDILLEEGGVEGYTAFYLGCCSGPMLVSYLFLFCSQYWLFSSGKVKRCWKCRNKPHRVCLCKWFPTLSWSFGFGVF